MDKLDTLYKKIINEQFGLDSNQEAEFKKENGTLANVMDALGKKYTIEYEDGAEWKGVNADELAQTIVDILEANPEDKITVTRN